MTAVMHFREINTKEYATFTHKDKLVQLHFLSNVYI